MKSTDLINFFVEEAQHHVINDEQVKSTKSALKAQGKRNERDPMKKKDKNKSNKQCVNSNCSRNGHTIKECWEKGRGKEGQGSKQNKGKKKDKKDKLAVIAENNKNSSHLPALLTTQH